MKLLEICPLCNGNLQYGARTESFNYKDKTFTVDMYGEYCSECNESFYNIDDAKKNERNIALAKRHIDGMLRPEDITRIRKKMGLSQIQASELFGGGVRSFHKYEKGIIAPPKSLDILLRLIDDGKATLEDLSTGSRKTA
ncbi:type II toxin-antitoxin system MqsA family antitoxin [Sulfuricurvum sp.]|uniref:type II toxin-antitoxin system MqsA family antitoxin n=1 Tax=Sulfuricurvum sp. TaxID=2025608 RepID=UPI002620B650|nr:type II toxin-antitoxin system MqsA family antitoxin [Sulfuricurvum sp.]MDD4950904.1 type II toxin-antitoxin system MqsA family antitoxin [Sulfuricurvum sp.]